MVREINHQHQKWRGSKMWVGRQHRQCYAFPALFIRDLEVKCHRSTGIRIEDSPEVFWGLFALCPCRSSLCPSLPNATELVCLLAARGISQWQMLGRLWKEDREARMLIPLFLPSCNPFELAIFAAMGHSSPQRGLHYTTLSLFKLQESLPSLIHRDWGSNSTV